MVNIIKISILVLWLQVSFSQSFTAEQLVEKSIMAHDPKGRYDRFNETLDYQIVRDGHQTRNFILKLNPAKDRFSYEVKSDSVNFIQSVDKGKCTFELNGNTTFSDEAAAINQLTCERTKYLRDVYFYLFGLPYKIKDKGVQINSIVEVVVFDEKESYKLKVNFDKEVGADTWWFFIDKTTFLINGYQFLHGTGPGEFIYLRDNIIVGDVLMAKTKLWHWNDTKVHFRTDTINKK